MVKHIILVLSVSCVIAHAERLRLLYTDSAGRDLAEATYTYWQTVNLTDPDSVEAKVYFSEGGFSVAPATYPALVDLDTKALVGGVEYPEAAVAELRTLANNAVQQVTAPTLQMPDGTLLTTDEEGDLIAVSPGQTKDEAKQERRERRLEAKTVKTNMTVLIDADNERIGVTTGLVAAAKGITTSTNANAGKVRSDLILLERVVEDMAKAQRDSERAAKDTDQQLKDLAHTVQKLLKGKE